MNQPVVASFPKLNCLKCGHEWIPRVPAPTHCPSCKNPRFWERQKLSALPAKTCLRCGHEWFPRTSTPTKCPNCKNIRFWEKSKRGKKSKIVSPEAKTA